MDVVVMILIVPAFVLMVASVLSAGQHRQRRRQHAIDARVERLRRDLLTSNERDAEDLALEEIEDQKRRIHGVYCADGT